MNVYEMDYLAMAPVWGTVTVEALDAEEAENEGEMQVRSIHEGAVDISIKDVTLVKELD